MMKKPHCCPLKQAMQFNSTGSAAPLDIPARTAAAKIRQIVENRCVIGDLREKDRRERIRAGLEVKPIIDQGVMVPPTEARDEIMSERRMAVAPVGLLGSISFWRLPARGAPEPWESRMPNRVPVVV